MENAKKDRKRKQFERLFTAVLLTAVAALLLVSIGYTPRLWGVKVVLALGLVAISAFLGRKYAQERRDLR